MGNGALYMEDEEKKCDNCDRNETCLIDGDYRRACKREKYQYYRKVVI